MKIVIDARMYGLGHAGIGRYVSNLIREIKNQKSKIKNLEIILLVRSKNLEEIKKEVGKKIRLEVIEAPHYSFQEQIFLPIKLLSIKPDLVHFPHFNVPVFWWGKQVVTIHDLIKHQSKGRETTTRMPFLYWFKYLNYRFLVWLAVKRAIRVIVPSHYWKDRLVQIFKLKPQKVFVTHEGIEDKFKIKNEKLKMTSQNGKILEKYKITKPFVIYTGNLYPHKNIERLVQAIKHLNQSSIINHQSSISLVLVCSRNIFYERFKKKVKEMKAEKFANLVGFVPDGDLVILYQQAEAFVLPTLLEGFGLIGLEAMAAGLPVVCSDIPVLNEIYGEAALYFDPLDVDDMAEKIRKAIGDKKIRDKLIKKGFEQVKKYSWQKMAKKTLEIYESCASV